MAAARTCSMAAVERDGEHEDSLEAARGLSRPAERMPGSNASQPPRARRPCIANKLLLVGTTTLDVGHHGHAHPGKEILVRDRSQGIVAACRNSPAHSFSCVDVHRRPILPCAEHSAQ